MLIEFTVANFGSFKEPQVLEMAPASNIRKLSENCFSTGLANQPRRLLRSAMVYGPNASGKTHLVKAAYFVREMVLNSNRKKVEEPIKTDPFLIDLQTRFEPSAFQMIFVVDGQRHQYGFKVDHKRVWNEWCYIFPRRQGKTAFFRRDYDADKDIYNVETNALEGLKDSLESVPEDWLALTQFGQEKKIRWPQLAATYRWFQQQLRVIHPDGEITPIDALNLCEKPQGRDWVLSFLKAADLGIENIEAETFNETFSGLSKSLIEFLKDNPPNELSKKNKIAFRQAVVDENWEALSELGLKVKRRELKTIRTIPQTGETVPFDWNKESTGTQKMFALAGGWKDILDEGQVFFIDELETGLHHRLARFLLELIHDPERNTNGAQLIATTHDTALLDNQIIRPDQIWLMNKNRAYASRMYPLSDFDIKLKKHETLQKFYLDGHYGAVPMVRKRRIPITDSGENKVSEGGDEDAGKNDTE